LGKWGGAIVLNSLDKIRVNDRRAFPMVLTLSCSGFPEIFDECFTLWLAHKYFNYCLSEILDIIVYRGSWNEQIQEMLEYLKKY